MAVPGVPLNYPLAILAIFLRRLVDRVRKTPRSAILKQSVWYSCYLLTQEQWPALVGVAALCCAIGRFCKYRAPGAFAKLAKIKANAINSSIRHKLWVRKRKSWLRKFRERKQKEPALKVGVSNLVCQMRSRPSFHPTVSDENIALSNKYSDKSTFVTPSSSNKCLQTDAYNLKNSFSELSLHSQFSTERRDRELDRNRDSHLQWPEQEFPSSDENLDDNGEPVNAKYMDPMCDILPMGCVTFSEFNNKDDDKSDEEEQLETPKSQIQPKQTRKRKKRVAFAKTAQRPCFRTKLKTHATISDSFLIRKTRSGKIYGFQENVSKTIK